MRIFLFSALHLTRRVATRVAPGSSWILHTTHAALQRTQRSTWGSWLHVILHSPLRRIWPLSAVTFFSVLLFALFTSKSLSAFTKIWIWFFCDCLVLYRWMQMVSSGVCYFHCEKKMHTASVYSVIYCCECTVNNIQTGQDPRKFLIFLKCIQFCTLLLNRERLCIFLLPDFW